ncbi:MAG TPA: hypothetical protein PLP11_08450, partial [Bacteroidales bacterium]|nr:hypothetical protein [Bacteroidales bacterium]
GPVLGGTYVNCEGTRTYTYTYADCEGNSHNWVYTYTIEVLPFPNPPDGSSTVDCIADAVAPTLPVVTDNCGNTLTPTGPTIGGTYVNCEGTRTYTYVYTDCEGNTQDWLYTYAIDDNTPPSISGSIPVSNISGCDISAAPTAASTVAELETLGLAISDNCTSDANMTVSSSDAVAGSCPIVITRTFTVRDACLNASTYIQTININDITPPTASVPAPVTVECS